MRFPFIQENTFKKFLAILLICILFISQTIRVEFFGTANAQVENYRDIVSIVVDNKTYKKLSKDIRQYATNIQNHFGSTRTVIMVIDEKTKPENIAQYNEKLYYEGDEESQKSQLVGTVLIGNVPIPMVMAHGKYFPSLFPYVDFDNKSFIFNEKSTQYELSDSAGHGAVEIWHGVINPSIGRKWNENEDIELIKNFLEKTNDFHKKQGKFTPVQDVSPRVFYFDGFMESKSLDARSVFQYQLGQKNIENSVYNRFTKHSLSTINQALNDFDAKNNKEENDLLLGLNIPGITADALNNGGLSEKQIADTPDIHVDSILNNGYLKSFDQIFNKKVLGEELKAVHNAGRYNDGSVVNADLVAIQVALMDEQAKNNLKRANDLGEAIIKDFLESEKLIRKVPILDSMNTRYGDEDYSVPYKNYFFGLEGSHVSQANQCTIARGSATGSVDFAKGVQVEANVARDIKKLEEHLKILKEENIACIGQYEGDKWKYPPKTLTYWGRNSMLGENINTSGGANILGTEPVGNLKNMTSSIFSLGGMVESKRITTPTLAQCLDYEYQYTLVQPHKYSVLESGRNGYDRIFAYYPSGTRGDRFLCDSQVRPITEVNTYGKERKIQAEDIITEFNKYKDGESCLVGKIVIDGKDAQAANRECIRHETISSYDDDGSRSTETITINETHYRNLNYHTIDGMLEHISPTQEELEAADESGVNSAIPVNIDRYIEFLTKDGRIEKLQYFNFFRSKGSDAHIWKYFENWWTDLQLRARDKKLSNDEEKFVEEFLGAKKYITDISTQEFLEKIKVKKGAKELELLFEEIEKSQKWLDLSLEEKYKKAVEISLSENGSQIKKSTPYIHSKSDFYEIAYLGLSPLMLPSSHNQDFDKIISDYNQKLAALHGLNITEETKNLYNADSSNNSGGKDEKCGPPEGVSIFKWPQAIKCWMQAQMPPKISAGKCGGSTIGHNHSQAKPQSNFSDIREVDLQKKMIESSRVVTHFPRTHLSYFDTISFSSSFQNDENIILPPEGATAKLQIVSVKVQGKDVDQSKYDEYFSISPTEYPVGNATPNFIISTKNKDFSLVARIVYQIPLFNGEIKEVISDNFTFSTSSHYLFASLEQESGEGILTIPVNPDKEIFLKVLKKDNTSNNESFSENFSVTIFDDISGRIVAENIIGENGLALLPKSVTSEPSSYRAEILDNEGIAGSFTFSVQAGDLKKISLKPLSSALVKGSTTSMLLTLEDAHGYAPVADLYSVDISVENGFILDNSGNPVKNISLDIFDSALTFSVRTDNTGELKVSAKVNGLTTQKTLKIFDEINLRIQLQAPEIGGEDRDFRILVVDKKGERIQGFSSLATLSLPLGAGSFNKESIEIKNGESEIIKYTPGTVAGRHNLTLTIPGLGVFDKNPLTLTAGKPMNIESFVNGDKVSLFVKDRYGNVTNFDGKGYIWRNDADAVELLFHDGKATVNKEPGKYILEIPDIANNTISYEENGEKYEIFAISKIAFEIPSHGGYFDFNEDYKAHYTVLAGGSFLQEAEKMLYSKKFSIENGNIVFKENSQELGRGLAVSTLLDSPYTQETLFSLFPNGGYTLGQIDDALVETSLGIERGFPVLNIYESVRKNSIAKVLYRMKNAQFQYCESNVDCSVNTEKNVIFGKVVLNDDQYFSWSTQGDRLVLLNKTQPLLIVKNDGSIEKQSSIDLKLRNYKTTGSFVMEVYYQGDIIAELHYQYSENNSVELQEDIFSESQGGSLVLQALSYNLESFSHRSLNSESIGYRIKKETLVNTFDATKISPNLIDDIGTITEGPNVGWMGNNRMLLSYASGDTVGESTKWFHTYMFVNLGDPTTHVDTSVGHITQLDGLDRSLGVQIADSKKSRIVNHFQKDMNADGLIDVLVQYSDGYIELFLNLRDKFRSVGNIAYIPHNLGDRLEIADFQGDGFSDIIAINKEGKLSVVSNNNRRFTEQKISVQDNEVLPSHIQQMKIYDMDADKKDDIVYLTSGGELGILYGTDVSGKFFKKTLDSTLGITLSGEGDKYGGALKSSSVPQLENLGVTSSSHDSGTNENPKIPDTMVLSEVYHQELILKDEVIESKPFTGSLDINSIFGNNNLDDSLETTAHIVSRKNIYETYIKSQYASLVGANIEKKYLPINREILFPDDLIQVEITIRNDSSEVMKNIKYLDTISPLFARDDSQSYTIEINGNKVEKGLQEAGASNYDLIFQLDEVPVGSSAKIKYTLKVLPASYGEMLVGNFEKGLVGEDDFGDISFKTSTTCGAEAMNWLSTSAREYLSSRSQSTFGGLPFPEGVEDEIADKNNNNIPDKHENMTPEEGKKHFKKMKRTIIDEKVELDWNANTGDATIKASAKLNPKVMARLDEKAQEIADGLSCGFGGGSCMSFPLNWAPLAPGSDPVIFGTPVGDGLKVNEGMPIFSALTTMYTPYGPVPSVWPPMSAGAGGYFGETAPYSSFIRMFVTPTLTMGMGAAICLGTYPSVVGNMPPSGLSPLIQGGNCIVIAKSMPVCKGDGSKVDGDISAISGLVNAHNGIGATHEVWNGKSCSLQVNPTHKIKDDQGKLEQEVIAYMKNPSQEKLKIISAKISTKNISSLNSGPLLKVGSGTDAVEINIDSNTKISDIGKVINPKNIRIAAFPDFVMDWLTRQTEEVVNSLFSPPNLTVIPPTDFGQNAKINGDFNNFIEDMGKALSKEGLKNTATQLGESVSQAFENAKGTEAVNQKLTRGQTGIAGEYYSQAVKKATSTLSPIIDKTSGGLASIRSVYTFLGKMPFMTIRQHKINVNVPWILPSELDQYERKLKDYKNTLENAKQKWCLHDGVVDCAKAKVDLKEGGLLSDIQQNLKRIEEYRNFPEKLQKYITWKDKLMYDILCNLEAIEKMTFSWVRENGIRFQRWAELFVLIRAIAESWQPIVDIFANMSASCGVCRNERYNSQYWKFKLISMIIPTIPVIAFPKWPDIVLDLSDIRLGINISLPDFNFRISPIRLPSLPDFSLPGSPNASFNLPRIPVLPALPDLPDLPRIPSLPTVKLPDLPPPPKIPRLAGAIKATTDILKLIAKMYCYYQKTFLIPEWQVGDVIAQRTERQGTLPMDFLNVQFPQFSLPQIKEIRVATHVNYQIKTDFITEFAKNAVKGINKFSTDIANEVPESIKALDHATSKTQREIDNAKGDVRDIIKDAEKDVNNEVKRVDKHTEERNKEFDRTEQDWQKESDRAENKLQGSLFLKDIKNMLDPYIQKMEQEKDIFHNTEEFYVYFKGQLKEAGLTKIASELDLKMELARKNSQKLIKEIEDFNHERFNLYKKFLQEEERKSGKMKNVIDLLREGNPQLLAGNSVTIGQLASDNTETSLALSQLAALETRSMEELSAPQYDPTDLTDLRRELTSRVNRIAQLTPDERNIPKKFTPTTNAVSNNYLPKFDGMYVLTEKTKTQTKLFDYTELLTSRDRVDVLDIDRDGDKDYIFLLGGILYVKKTHLDEKSQPKIIDNTTSVVEISTTKPFIPNNFRATLSSPNELNIAFENALSTEEEWRMEFFDSYMEWDFEKISKNKKSRTIVDLFIKKELGDFDNDGIRKLAIARSIESGYNNKGFIIEGPKITKLSGSDIFISLSPNRTIYTPNHDVEIWYKNSHDQEEKRLKLEQNHGYQFDITTDIRASGGPLYIIGGGSSNHKYSDVDNLEGLPILPGMKVVSESGFTIKDLTHKERLVVNPHSLYIAKNLVPKKSKYSFSIPYPNGYYYARLNNLSGNMRDRVGVVLFAPQAGSDTTNPVLTLPSTIRVPVYAQEKFLIKDFVTELSKYSLEIDEDISQDLDNNAIFDDDFVKKGSMIEVNDRDLILGPINEIGNKNMILRVKDEFGNTTILPLVVEVFAPIPTITEAHVSGKLSGNLNLPITNEPIDFFRIRNSVEPLRLTNTSVLTQGEGKFSSGVMLSPEEIIVTSSGASWKVSSNGVLQNLPQNFGIQVSPATEKNPMSINVYDDKNNQVYQQFISLPHTAQILDKKENVDIPSGNIYVTTHGDIKFISAGYDDPIIPGGAYVANSRSEALFVIAKDGNIYLLDDQILLEYQEKDNYIQIVAKKSGTVFAELWYKIDFFYTTK